MGKETKCNFLVLWSQQLQVIAEKNLIFLLRSAGILYVTWN